MTVQEHLLTCLIEECAEVSHRACKALRFGIDDSDPTIENARTERVMLKQELTDLFAVVELLFDQSILPDGFDRDAAREKKKKVRKFMDYARERGALS